MPWIPAAIIGGSAIASGAISGIGSIISGKKSNDTNKAIAEENLEFQKATQQTEWERQDTAYQRAVQDMYKAGLNPLAGVNTAESAASVAPQNGYQSDPTAAVAGFGQIGQGVQSALNSAVSAYTGVSQAHYQDGLLQAQQQANFINAYNAYTNRIIEFADRGGDLKRFADMMAERAVLENKSLNKGLGLVDSQIALNEKQIDVLSSQIGLNQANTRKVTQEIANLIKQNDLTDKQIEKIKKDMNLTDEQIALAIAQTAQAVENSRSLNYINNYNDITQNAPVQYQSTVGKISNETSKAMSNAVSGLGSAFSRMGEFYSDMVNRALSKLKGGK